MLVLLSVGLVGMAFGAGFGGRAWLAQLLLVVALAQGFVAGAVFPAFWRTRPADAGSDPGAPAIGLPGRIVGPEGRYLLFLVSVAFAAVEAHAVGTGMARGAPGAAAALLVPPVAVAALALRGAVRSAPRAGGER